MKLGKTQVFLFERLSSRCAGWWLAIALLFPVPCSLAQETSAAASASMSIHGSVQDAQGHPAAGAVVSLETADAKTSAETPTDAQGRFSFEHLFVADYQLIARKSHSKSLPVVVRRDASSNTEFTLALSSEKPQSAAQEMEFSDQPHFTVAGVTDWTAAGGHGSDTTLRASENLASATASLKPEHRDAPENAPAAAYRRTAEADESRGDALAAVKEFEQAATLDPSEQNQFEWASDLLLHRAIWQAEAVFRRGAEAYPNSLRMQAGLGAALFAGARYQDAALQLCRASDLDPANPDPYLLLGQIEFAAPHSLDCVTPKLARFAQMNPGNSTATYLYAMTLIKGRRGPTDAQSLDVTEGLLKKAILLDSKSSAAYLELGILAAAKHEDRNAIGFYMQAIAADPQSADAHYRLGVAYDRTGDHAKAAQEFGLHKQIQQQQSQQAEEQRKAVKQFLFATPPDNP